MNEEHSSNHSSKNELVDFGMAFVDILLTNVRFNANFPPEAAIPLPAKIRDLAMSKPRL